MTRIWNSLAVVAMLVLAAMVACTSPVAPAVVFKADSGPAEMDAGLDAAAGDIDDALADVVSDVPVPDVLLDALPDVLDATPDGPPDVPPTLQDGCAAPLPADVSLSADVSPCDQVLPTTTIGVPCAIPVPCNANDCAACGAPYQCTCAGDGATPCAWAAMAPMHFPRYFHGATWGDAKLYVFAGSNADTGWQVPVQDPSQPGILTTAEVWDPATNQWTLLPQAPVYPPYHAPVVWGDGKLYVTGDESYTGNPFAKLPWGPNYADFAAYDPKTNKWTALNKNGSPGACGGPWTTMVWFKGKLFVSGCKAYSMGEDGSKKGASASIYEAATDSWTPWPPLPAGVLGYAGVPGLLVGSKVVFWEYEGTSKPSYGTQFDIPSGTWQNFPPPDCAPYLRDENRVVIDGGGVFYWGSNKLANPHAAWIRWVDKGEWETVSVPDWFKPNTDRGVAWTGKYVVLWGGGLYQSALYDPAAHVWLPLPKLGQPAMRYLEAFLGRPGEVFVVGGLILAAQNYATVTTGRLLLPP